MREMYIPPCSGISVDVSAGQTIYVTDVEGGQVADFFAETRQDAGEFLSTGVTIDCNSSVKLHVGDYLYSNLYRPMFRIMSDDVGKHDLLHPCCRPEMYDFFYHNGAGHKNRLDTINACLQTHRPIIHPVNLFMHTSIEPDGSLKVRPPVSKAGDTIVLRAETDVRLGIAACSVSESDCNGGKCTGIRICIRDAVPD